MSTSHTKIQWADRTWNVVRGCSLVSAGCTNCYAQRHAHRFSGKGQPYAGLTRMTEHGPVWTGKIRLVSEALEEPLRWRKPCRVFVNSMADLFAEDVPDDFIYRVFAIMALSPEHTFQILTKRPERMRRFLTEPVKGEWAGRAFHEDGPMSHAEFQMLDEIPNALRHYARLGKPFAHALNRASMWQDAHYPDGEGFMRCWPLPNVWLGVSVEDQKTADARIPILLNAPAAVRFVSAEPLLERIELRDGWRNGGCRHCSYSGYLDSDVAGWVQCSCCMPHCRDESFAKLDWVIVGGESGPHARPCPVEWIRDIVRQCKAARTPCFVKQLGAGPKWDRDESTRYLRDRKGGDMDEWPEDLRVRQWPN